MNSVTDIPAKLAEIKQLMEQEEWTRAIREIENIGTVPDKLLPIVSNIIFYLYISRNEYEKLVRLSDKFEPGKSKHVIAALLLLRDKELGYPVRLPQAWNVETWEAALEDHALAGRLEPKEIPLCLHFLSILNRPRLLELLVGLAIEAGGCLDNDLMEVILRCYTANRWFGEARRLLWAHNTNNVGFERFDFLVDRLENSTAAIPQSNDKFLNFLRHRFGATLPNLQPVH